MTKKDQHHAALKSKLVALRERLTRTVDATAETLREDLQSPGELSHLPTHLADHAIEGVDEQIAISHNEERLLADVEAAIDRLEMGTYGRCIECGRPIDAARLEAIPYTPWCIACAKGHSKELESPA